MAHSCWAAHSHMLILRISPLASCLESFSRAAVMTTNLWGVQWGCVKQQKCIPSRSGGQRSVSSRKSLGRAPAFLLQPLVAPRVPWPPAPVAAPVSTWPSPFCVSFQRTLSVGLGPTRKSSLVCLKIVYLITTLQILFLIRPHSQLLGHGCIFAGGGGPRLSYYIHTLVLPFIVNLEGL